MATQKSAMDSGVGIAGHSKSVLQMTTSKLDYEAPFIVENGVTKSHEIVVQTQSNISSNGPIDFHLQPDPEKFTDSSSVVLHGKAGLQVFRKVQNKWETVKGLDPTPAFGVINNFFASLISSCVVKVNDCEIGETSTNSYPYMSYLQTLLGTSASQSGCEILKERLFIKDGTSDMETPNTTDANCAFLSRRAQFLLHDMVDFHIPLHNDIMTAEKYLPPNVKLSFTLKRTDNDFVIWKDSTDNQEYRVVLEDIYLTIDQVEVSPEIMDGYMRKFVKADKPPPVQIKYTQNVFKTFAVPTNQTELKHHNLFFGSHLPDKCYVAIVEQDSYNGDAKKNPFNLEMANFKEAYLVVNGIKEPTPTYQFVSGSEENTAYLKFLSNTGTSPFEMDGVNVSSKEFKKGYFVLAYDRSPTRDNGLYTHKAQRGSMSVVIKCSQATTKNYMVLVMASYDSVLSFYEDKVTTETVF